MGRKWEETPTEKAFVEVSIANGFSIEGIREYTGKTEFLCEKDGVQIEASIPNRAGVKADGIFNFMEKSWEMKKEIIQLKKEIIQ